MIFAQHVVDGKSRVDAYRLAGYKCEGDNAYFAASQIYRNIQVRRYIHAIRNERQKRYAAELDDVIGQLTAIINADPNEISQYRRVNCRYCWEAITSINGEISPSSYPLSERLNRMAPRRQIHPAELALSTTPIQIQSALAVMAKG